MRFIPGGFGFAGNLFGAVFAGLLFILCAVIALGLLVVVVRFLLVATRAAEIYVRTHEPAQPATPGAPAAPAAARAPATPTTPTTSSVAAAPTKPVTKPRTPKAPPTV